MTTLNTVGGVALDPSDSADHIRALAIRYGQAWNDHDVDAILSMHAPASVFQLHIPPYPPASTHPEIRDQFAALFSIMPDMVFDTQRLSVRDGLFVQEWELSATLMQPFPIGDRVAQPDGKPIRFAGMDVIPCERGLITRKDCYLDAVTLLQQLSFR